jgi:hypothetical protein
MSGGHHTFSTSKWSDWTANEMQKVLVGDFDGDGKDDVMKLDVGWTPAPRGVWVGLSRVDANGKHYFATTKWATWTTYPHMLVQVGDFDGDGKDDLMKFDVATNGDWAERGLWVGLSRGGSAGRYFSTSKWTTWHTQRDMTVFAADIDGDGRTDVGKIDPETLGAVWTGTSTGTSFTTHHAADVPWTPTTHFLFGDYDGDGEADLASLYVR